MKSLEQIVAELAGLCRRYASPLEVGLGSSNRPATVTSDETKVFLDVKLPDLAPGGCDGMATVHVYAQEILPEGLPNPAANSSLLVTAIWQSGLGGGETEVDGAHGFYLTLGANSAIRLEARLVPAVAGAALVVGSTYRVEATTKWYTSVGASRPVLSLAARPVDEGGVSEWFKIPRQARTFGGYALDGAAYATLVAELATVPDPGAVRYQSLVAPRRELVLAGTEWIRFRSATATLVFPAFELWA